jgi:hypothetical protein
MCALAFLPLLFKQEGEGVGDVNILSFWNLELTSKVRDGRFPFLGDSGEGVERRGEDDSGDETCGKDW